MSVLNSGSIRWEKFESLANPIHRGVTLYKSDDHKSKLSETRDSKMSKLRFSNAKSPPASLVPGAPWGSCNKSCLFGSDCSEFVFGSTAVVAAVVVGYGVGCGKTGSLAAKEPVLP